MKNKMDIVHEGMRIKFEKIYESYGIKQFSPGTNANGKGGDAVFPGFHLSVAGENYGIFNGSVIGGSILPLKSKCTNIRYDSDGVSVEYLNETYGLQITTQMKFVKGARVIRQINSIKNTGNASVVLTHFSSANITGIATDGLLPWHHKDKIRIHYCINSWEGEGQWRTATLEELGLYHCSTHQCARSVHFSSKGSWSTGQYVPVGFVEDIETGQIWYFQIESSSNWHFEIGHRKSEDGADGTLYIEMDCADEIIGGWHKELRPGEEFIAEPVAFGCTYGGFEEAVRELTKYRRNVLKPQNAWEGEFPVFFNDYMNALWGNPNEQKLKSLIDAAASVGAEGFCIDTGWYVGSNDIWGNGLGDWIEAKDRFGSAGLKGIVDYIRSKGMIAGIWLEMEACHKTSDIYNKPDSWFVCSHGKRLGGDRCFFDFRNAEVREYIHGRIATLMDMGFGFIKNDYNQPIVPGVNNSADELLESMHAFYSFIDEVRERYPRLILENCGSGAMREDYGLLSRFHIQSTSDQEIYYRYPSIITGTLANVLPEQAGIWAYPYPLLYKDLNNPEILYSSQYKEMMADGEQTIFNMVNGFCGNMYVSGRIDLCDEYNLNLISEAISLYKNKRSFIRNSYPVWPTGLCRISSNGFASMGLISSDFRRVLLAVWRLDTSEKCINIDLSKFTVNSSRVQLIYPQNDSKVKYGFNPGNKSLSIAFDRPFSARLFEIEV